MSVNLDTSFNTSEILNIAEKLVDDVEKKIVQVSYDIKNFRLDDDSYADESELYIRDVVNTKFKELNQDKFSLDNDCYFDENQIEYYQYYNYELRKNDEKKLNRVSSIENNNKQTITDKEIKNDSKSKPQSKIKFKKGTFNKTDSITTQSSQLSLKSALKVDLLVNDTDIDTRNNNLNIPELTNDSCERKKLKESFVDTAVQTSIQEIPHDKLASLDKSSELLADINISNNSIRNDEIKPETINVGNSKQQNLSKTNLQQRVLNDDNKKSKGSFIEFICRIAELEANNLSDVNSDNFIEENQNKTTEIEIINEDFDFNEIKLYSPKFERIDKILNNFDKKIKTFVENTNKLVNIFPQISCYNNNNVINLKISKRENNFDGVKLSLKPQSRNLSSETTITSESFKPPERFSTPLNNYSVNIETKNTCNDIEELPIPISKLDKKNDSKVFITRNKLSLSAASETNIENSDKITVEDKSEFEVCLSETLQHSQQQINDKIDSEEGNDFSQNYTVKKLDCQQEPEISDKKSVDSFNINSQKISDSEKKKVRSKEFVTSKEKTLSKSVKLQESSNNNQLQANKKEESDNLDINLIVDSSKDDLRDRTSFDVSAIYSESFETASFTENENALEELKEINDKIENFELNQDNDVKLGPYLSIDCDKNKISVHNVIEESKSESKTNEKIKSISINDNNKENSINQSNNLNSSVQSSTTRSENKKEHTLSLQLCQQSSEKISLVETLQGKSRKSSSDNYSEGELYQPISLGEVRVNGTSSSQENSNSNYYQSLTDHIHDILNSSVQSLGEILNSNMGSTSSVTSRMTYSYY